MTPVLIKSFAALAAVASFSIVRAAVGGVQASGANTHPLIGVADSMGAELGGIVDVVQAGWGEVRAGGTIAFGDPLTSDAQGHAVKAVAVAGTVVRTIGFAMADADANDVFPVHIVPGSIGF